MRRWPGWGNAGWLWDNSDLPRCNLSAVLSMARLTKPLDLGLVVTVSPEGEVGSSVAEEAEDAIDGDAPEGGGGSGCLSCAMFATEDVRSFKKRGQEGTGWEASRRE